MNRFLSEALQAPEPFFSLGLRRLEAANGHPAADIRLSTEVRQAARTKLPLLGLDPADTTPAELYHALQERIKADDAKLVKTLRTQAAIHVTAEGDVVDGMVHVLKHLPGSRRCFAIKSSSFKAIIKQLPPKKTMKLLGYRSLSSYLKHESAVSILSMARLHEDARWHQRLLKRYEVLRPRDFETRPITITATDAMVDRQFAQAVVNDARHNVLSLPELGAVVLLPLPRDLPAGTATASLSLALCELNAIHTTATFLKLSQVRPDFGHLVRLIATEEPALEAPELDRAVPWHLIQRYYAAHPQLFSEHVFEPHIQLEDMTWQTVEKTLARLEPSFAFWHPSAHLGITHGGRPVSLNVIDAALNCCNHLPFERRLSHYFRRSLGYELLLRYLQPAFVEQAVSRALQPALATEAALA